MSSDDRGDYLDSRCDEYASILRQCLAPDLRHFITFFSDTRRLRVMAQMLQRHLTGLTPGRVLNIGCGPFATEYFVRCLHAHGIVSFDYTAGFAPAYAALKARGHLGNTCFMIADALTVEFRPQSFCAIIMHDILYEPALDAARLIARFDGSLRPGGLVFLSVQDMRTRWIWRLAGRERAYKRYELPAVQALLRAQGYEVLECRPSSLETRGRLNQTFRKLLWHVFGLANQHAIIARKPVHG